MTTPYIPPQDSLFLPFLENFASRISAAPMTYGLTAGDAAIIQGVASAFSAAYQTAIEPSTRTASAVAQKDADRAAAEATIRPYAMQIQANLGVSNQEKSDLGLTIRDTTPTPFPPPETAPTLSLVFGTPLAHQLQYRDALAPLLKRKPAGVVALELYRAIGPVAAISPSDAPYVGDITKTPFTVDFQSEDRGQVSTYFGRWKTRSGPSGVAQTGPWSEALSVVVL